MPRTDEIRSLAWYREFVYVSGAVERDGTARTSDALLKQVVLCNGQMGIYYRFRYRIKNFSEGIALGGPTRIIELQIEENRKKLRARDKNGAVNKIDICFILAIIVECQKNTVVNILSLWKDRKWEDQQQVS
ncbi:MAG: hypothetical protein GY757_45795 [bacterium]|nr:hypothetical protein [bacterium]